MLPAAIGASTLGAGATPIFEGARNIVLQPSYVSDILSNIPKLPVYTATQYGAAEAGFTSVYDTAQWLVQQAPANGNGAHAIWNGIAASEESVPRLLSVADDFIETARPVIASTSQTIGEVALILGRSAGHTALTAGSAAGRFIGEVLHDAAWLAASPFINIAKTVASWGVVVGTLFTVPAAMLYGMIKHPRAAIQLMGGLLWRTGGGIIGAGKYALKAAYNNLPNAIKQGIANIVSGTKFISNRAVGAASIIRRGVVNAGNAISGVTGAAGRAIGRGASGVGNILSKASKYLRPVVQVAGEALSLYFLYVQAKGVALEADDLAAMKVFLAEHMKPGQQFQIDEYVRQHEESLLQHRVDLGIATVAAGLSAGLTLYGVLTGAALTGPLGWIAGIIAVTGLAAAYVSNKFEETRLRNENNEWLNTWYGNAEIPSLEFYLQKRDPSGELAAWVKGVMSIQPDEKYATPAYKIYIAMLQAKVLQTMEGYQAGIIDPRFEELQALKDRNSLLGAITVDKKWRDENPNYSKYSPEDIYAQGSADNKRATIYATSQAESGFSDHKSIFNKPVQVSYTSKEQWMAHKELDEAVKPMEKTPNPIDAPVYLTPFETKDEFDANSSGETVPEDYYGVDGYFEYPEARANPQGLHYANEEAIIEDELDARNKQNVMDQMNADLQAKKEEEPPQVAENSAPAEDTKLDQTTLPHARQEIEATSNGYFDMEGFWHYPQGAKRAFNQEGLLYDDELRQIRRRRFSNNS